MRLHLLRFQYLNELLPTLTMRVDFWIWCALCDNAARVKTLITAKHSPLQEPTTFSDQSGEWYMLSAHFKVFFSQNTFTPAILLLLTFSSMAGFLSTLFLRADPSSLVLTTL
jgi:hypothetical protein